MDLSVSPKKLNFDTGIPMEEEITGGKTDRSLMETSIEVEIAQMEEETYAELKDNPDVPDSLYRTTNQ